MTFPYKLNDFNHCFFSVALPLVLLVNLKSADPVVIRTVWSVRNIKEANDTAVY
ncbi:hypothetical protein D3C79_1072410 [compost metagenome]